jgi:Glycosyl hydrolase family 1
MQSKFLLFGLLLAALQVDGLYTDEPLLYDTFPPNFMWAAATSAHQIEGGWDADGVL